MSVIVNCVVCNSNTNLNTEMSIIINDEKIKVKICDEHAEDITPKIAREAYVKRKSEIDELIEKAKALGLDFTQKAPPGAIHIPQRLPVAQQHDVTQLSSLDADLDGEDLIPTSVVDTAMKRVAGTKARIESGGSGGSYNVEGHNVYDRSQLDGGLPDAIFEGVAKMATFEGRQGQQVAIPAIRRDGTGTTRITINKGKGDATLQNNFRQLASSDMQTPSGAIVNSHGFAIDGYNVKPCNACDGTGSFKVRGKSTQSCPRCGGSGILN